MKPACLPRPRSPLLLLPASLATALAGVGLGSSAHAQDPAALIALSTNTPPATTTYLESRIPTLPWLPEEAPDLPDWVAQDRSAPAFLRPGLGTSVFGGGGFPSTALSRAGASPQLIPIGPFDLHPEVTYGFLYGTGLLSGPGREENTYRQTITPGIDIFAGDHWSVGYRPSFHFYSADGYENNVDHALTLSGWGGRGPWRVSLNHGTSISSDPLIETGAQTDQTTHSTSLGVGLDRGPRGYLNSSLSQNIRLTDESSDAHSWTWYTSYDVPIRETLRVGAGLGVGYDLVQPGSDMVNERLNLRVNGELGEKISYAISAGGEIRQFLESDASTEPSPVFSASGTYRVLQKTALSLGISHDISTSYFTDQFTRNTSVQGGVTQTLTDRWSVTASGGYRFTSYQSTLGDLSQVREDNSAFARFSVSARLFNRFRAAAFYSYRSNQSDDGLYDFDSNQVGIDISWSL